MKNKISRISDPSDIVSFKQEFPGPFAMQRQGWKRLASRVWQRVVDGGAFEQRAVEDGEWMRVSIVRS